MMDAVTQIQTIEQQLNAAFPERQAVVRGLLAAAITGEHVLILGPPGTGKSAIARAYAGATAGGSYFEKLLTKFTVPEEIFGPISFSALKQDRYERAVAGYAPEARCWFLDEVWKASSSILNTLLTAMQERTMTNGTALLPLPLQTVIGASNEYPQDDSLQALFDRFALKFWVDYLADAEHVRALYRNGGQPGSVTAMISAGDRTRLAHAAQAIPFTEGDIETLLTIKATVQDAGFIASDRTWMKALGLVRACAVLDGRGRILGRDFAILCDMLWREHQDVAQLREIVGNAADPYGARANAIIDAVRTAMGDLPSMDLLRTGAKKKMEMIQQLAVISGKVVTELDKILDIERETKDTAGTAAAKQVAEQAREQIDALMREVTLYRGNGGAQ